MKVTAITQQINDPERYSIFVDDVFVFGLIWADVAYFKIKEGTEISKETLGFIAEKLNYVKAQDVALNYIAYQMRSAAQVRIKLRQKEYTDEVIEEVLSFLEKYHYVDDLDYCCRYIRQRERLSPRGRYALKAELRQKGVNEGTIEKALLEADIDELESATRLLAKKCRNMEDIDEKEKKRLWGFLQRKGYSYDIIKEAYENFLASQAL